jgi:hypothetical protein
VNRQKLGARLAFLVHNKMLSVMGLELMADSFSTVELQEIGRHLHDARCILETASRARDMRRNLYKFTGEQDDEGKVA